MIKKVKNTVPWTYVVNDHNSEKIVGTFYGNDLQKKEFRTEKAIKKKDDKLYIKWKEYNNSFNRWCDKKDKVLTSENFPKPKSLGANIQVELD